MEIAELQRIALRISNQTFCRWWGHYNYPCENPWLMAIAFSRQSNTLYLAQELLGKGFTLAEQSETVIYTIERSEVLNGEGRSKAAS